MLECTYEHELIVTDPITDEILFDSQQPRSQAGGRGAIAPLPLASAQPPWPQILALPLEPLGWLRAWRTDVQEHIEKKK